MYLRRKILGFSYDEWHAMPWWLTRSYDEIMNEDMAGTLAEYAAESDPTDPNHRWFPDPVRTQPAPPAAPQPVGMVIHADPDPPVVVRTADIPPPKYDVPEYNGKEDSRPVSYVPARTLGMKIRKASPPRRDQSEQ